MIDNQDKDTRCFIAATSEDDGTIHVLRMMTGDRQEMSDVTYVTVEAAQAHAASENKRLGISDDDVVQCLLERTGGEGVFSAAPDGDVDPEAVCELLDDAQDAIHALLDVLKDERPEIGAAALLGNAAGLAHMQGAPREDFLRFAGVVYDVTAEAFNQTPSAVDIGGFAPPAKSHATRSVDQFVDQPLDPAVKLSVQSARGAIAMCARVVEQFTEGQNQPTRRLLRRIAEALHSLEIGPL